MCVIHWNCRSIQALEASSQHHNNKKMIAASVGRIGTGLSGSHPSGGQTSLFGLFLRKHYIHFDHSFGPVVIGQCLYKLFGDLVGCCFTSELSMDCLNQVLWAI
ncbi:uncharacterized protein LOC132303942 isoform X1 [Cornus florida]|uniref:uncharacterized protein LOC132303942 isoform X1 n=1 Tax=Cornus florida TaxID=4283 RepID=UPI0028965FAB|nr:uncharacterized protein LOC132303942 isoform X1 [Cornus florida]